MFLEPVGPDAIYGIELIGISDHPSQVDEIDRDQLSGTRGMVPELYDVGRPIDDSGQSATPTRLRCRIIYDDDVMLELQRPPKIDPAKA